MITAHEGIQWRGQITCSNTKEAMEIIKICPDLLHHGLMPFSCHLLYWLAHPQSTQKLQIHTILDTCILECAFLLSNSSFLLIVVRINNIFLEFEWISLSVYYYSPHCANIAFCFPWFSRKHIWKYSVSPNVHANNTVMTLHYHTDMW